MLNCIYTGLAVQELTHMLNCIYTGLAVQGLIHMLNCIYTGLAVQELTHMLSTEKLTSEQMRQWVMASLAKLQFS